MFIAMIMWAVWLANDTLAVHEICNFAPIVLIIFICYPSCCRSFHSWFCYVCVMQIDSMVIDSSYTAADTLVSSPLPPARPGVCQM